MTDKDVRSLKANTRGLRRELDQWQKKSRENGKPVCLTCARLDNVKGRMKDYEDYTKGFKVVREHKAMIKEGGSQNETPIPYVLIDYKCPRGHGVSMHYRTSEYNELKGKGDKSVKEK